LSSSPDQKFSAPVVLEISDDGIGLTGWLAVDSTINNHCCGGLRMAPGISSGEMRGLAKAMTLKYGFLGMPHGGAKAGILYDEASPGEDKIRLLASFGAKIRNLLAERVYSPGPDMGTNNEDIRSMLEAAGVRVSKRALLGNRSGWYTSLTVIAAAKVAAGYQGLDLPRSAAAIEGFGKVGSSVAQGLHQRGCKVVAISTSCGALCSFEGLDIAKLLDLSCRFGSKMVDHYEGAERIKKEELFELDVDILFPCARHHSITTGNASGVKAKLISPGANIPITPEAEELLFQRGVLCVPDFVANSGGVLGGTMEFAGLSRSAILNVIEHNFSGQVKSICEKSMGEGMSLRTWAENIAQDRFARVKAVSEDRSLRNKAFDFALDLYRNGVIPKIFVGALARRYFCNRIEQ
jgi:glutamate dehydrogenase (NAD(P)+)